ncbi:MAG TPA: hypothetical protein VNU24_02020 [Solirubrobacteraceae bacterium]|jgi:aspartate/glutamate racemase/prolyl-tRNA editing enzyme YbaK/EbsC (Cys-tRNA(Pro) deacylase)|nr:hypothetical protein [Solirubrobacteraceae bacterium]
MSEHEAEPIQSSGRERLPETVARTAEFLSEHEVWFRLARNPAVRSCRDAANKRMRLGQVGVPLWDELKSFFGVLRRPEGREQYVVVHCRGDRLIDLARVTEVVGGTLSRMAHIDLEGLGMAYGLVNPFEPWALDAQLMTSPVLQVFDRDLLTPIGIPGTVMTNAGDLTWSVEIRPGELADALDHKIVADVSVEDPDERARPAWAVAPKTIGIITGNGPESGMLLWRTINRIVREQLGRDARGDTVMPEVILRSLPEMGLTMELDRRHRHVWPALRKAAVELCRDGAEVLTLACNTTPYFAPELSKIAAEYQTTFVSMPDALGDWLRSRDIGQVALVGVKTVAELGPWSPYRTPLSKIEVELPNDQTMTRIHELAYQVKAQGADHASLNRLRDILREGVESRVVVLALTEISLVLELQKQAPRSDRLLVDTIELYAARIAGLYLGSDLQRIYGPKIEITSI